MDNQELEFIQNQIGYTFRNVDLLQQAFVRRSYAKENGGEDNEVLEFIGDKALDFSVVRVLMEKYGYLISECEDYNPNEDFNEFACEYDEGKLTEIKKCLVEKKMLAHRIDELGLSDYLIMGKGDRKNHIDEQASVKEDLFEAIVGAVTLDSKWDFAKILETVEVMLDPDSELLENSSENYVQIIQDWTEGKGIGIPQYYFKEASYSMTWYMPFEGISQSFNTLCDPAMEKVKYHCLMKISDELPIFRGFGESKTEARKAVCKLAYDYLEKKDLLFSIRDEIENPNRNNAINQLEILARRGYFSVPTYHFSQEYDGNGNPIWEAECCITEYHTTFFSQSNSKKDAKKSAAYKMLEYVLGGGEE